MSSRKFSIGMALLLMLPIAPNVSGQGFDDPAFDYVPGELIIRIKDGSHRTALRQRVKEGRMTTGLATLDGLNRREECWRSGQLRDH
jgi:hypothetical protein